MKKETLQDVNGKPSATRKILLKYIPVSVVFTYGYGVFSIITGNDIGKQTALIIIGMNGFIVGGGLLKMGIEHYKKKND